MITGRAVFCSRLVRGLVRGWLGKGIDAKFEKAFFELDSLVLILRLTNIQYQLFQHL